MLTETKNERHEGRDSFLESPGGLRAEQSRRVCSALLDSIARDVSRPLALIAGATASLRSNKVSSNPSVRSELLDVIEGEAARMERFAALILDMARLECDGVEIKPEAVAPADVVSGALNDAAGVLQEHRIDVQVPGDLPLLRVDATLLQRILILLVENAARQSPAGSTIGVHAGRDRTAVRLQVLDESEGIPPAELPGIFNQVTLPCTDEANRTRSGMDLAICHGFVEAIGGSISASNRTDGGGAVFTLTFPLAG